MESVAPECTEPKRRYEQCFNSWFAGKFLRGQAGPGDEDPCEALFKESQSCLKVRCGARRLY